MRTSSGTIPCGRASALSRKARSFYALRFLLSASRLLDDDKLEPKAESGHPVVGAEIQRQAIPVIIGGEVSVFPEKKHLVRQHHLCSR